MNEEKVDQRVRLTRNLLKNALVELMQTQHISKISVRALCEIAGINRSTFYMHYTDPSDLLRHVQDEVMSNLKRYLEKQDYEDNLPISIQVLTRILNYAKENSGLFKALLSENCDFAFQKDIMELAQILSFQLNPGCDARLRDYINVFGTTGCISVLQKWLQDGMIESPTQISGIVLQLCYQGVQNFQ